MSAQLPQRAARHSLLALRRRHLHVRLATCLVSHCPPAHPPVRPTATRRRPPGSGGVGCAVARRARMLEEYVNRLRELVVSVEDWGTRMRLLCMDQVPPPPHCRIPRRFLRFGSVSDVAKPRDKHMSSKTS